MKFYKTRKGVKTNFMLKHAKRKLEIQNILTHCEDYKDCQEVLIPKTPVDEAALLQKNISRFSLAQVILRICSKNFDENFRMHNLFWATLFTLNLPFRDLSSR